MYIKRRLESIKRKKRIVELLERLYEKLLKMDKDSEIYERLSREIAGIEFELEEMGVIV